MTEKTTPDELGSAPCSAQPAEYCQRNRLPYCESSVTKNKSNDHLALDRLAEFLVDDVLSMSDEEILAEVVADGEDPKRIAQETRSIFERAVTTCGKARLASAKKAVLSDRQQKL